MMDGFYGRLARYKKDERGIAAVEFALILPILIVLYFGTIELARILDANRRLRCSRGHSVICQEGQIIQVLPQMTWRPLRGLQMQFLGL